MPKKLRLLFALIFMIAIAAIPGVASAQTATPQAGFAFVLVGNFSPNSPPVDIFINGEQLGNNLAFSQATYPRQVRAGSIFIQIFNANTGALIVDGYKDVNANDYYMVPVMNVLERSQFGAYRIPVYEPLGAAETRVQFFHAVPQAPRLDVLNRTSNTRLVEAMGYVEDPRVLDHLTAGAFNWQVWTNHRVIFPGFTFDPNPAPDRLVIDMGTLNLRAGVVYSFFVIGAPAGSPSILALVLAMPLGGGNPVAPPGAGPGAFATPTRTPFGFVPTRTPTPGPATRTPVPTNTPVPPPAAAPIVSLDRSSATVNEGGSITINVVLDKAPAGTVRVSYSTGNITASSGNDFNAASGQITWNAGDGSAKQITLTARTDTIDEPDEDFRLSLSSPSGLTLGSPSSATITIVDQTPAPTLNISNVTVLGSPSVNVPEGQSAIVTVTLSHPSAFTVTASPVGGPTTAAATPGTDYAILPSTITFVPGDVTESFTVSTIQDNLPEVNEKIALTFSGVTNATVGSTQTLTIIDDEGAQFISLSTTVTSVTEQDIGGNVPVSLTISLTQPPASAISVDLGLGAASTATSADVSGLPFTLNIPSGGTSLVYTYTIFVTGDLLNEATETVEVQITGSTGASVDPANDRVTFSIVDNDAAPSATVALNPATAGSTGVTEGATVTVDVTLSAASGQPITFNLAATGGTASLGNDYTIASTTLTIPAGIQTGSFTVNTIDDSLDEPSPEDLDLAVTSTIVSTITGGTPTVLINDNDSAPNISISALTTPNPIEGVNATIPVTVTLSAASGNDVTFDLVATGGTATSGSDYTGLPATGITIPAGSLSATVNIGITDDAVDESATAETISLSLSGVVNATPPSFPPPVTVSIGDNDSIVTSIVATTDPITEGGSTTVTITLANAAAIDVTVNVSVTGDTGDFTVTGLPVTIAAGSTTGTFTVAGVPDAGGEPNETITLTVTSATNSAITASPETVTILAN